jgi:ppGpp synthetase/RelA/SpoT-type nucleotidyltranferase
MENKIRKYDNIIKELRAIYIAKNNDYGSSVTDTYNKFGDVSFMVRITDKINRATTLLSKNNRQVQDEKLEDTIKDMINYGILWLIEREENIDKIG